LTHTGADKSATETHDEAGAAASTTRLDAEGAAIHLHNGESRLTEEVIAFGIASLRLR
jgi:hypothetical protein